MSFPGFANIVLLNPKTHQNIFWNFSIPACDSNRFLENSSINYILWNSLFGVKRGHYLSWTVGTY